MRVISGGQTGADRAALDAAVEAGFDIGGWCPRGRWAEDGRIADTYPLRETPSPAVQQRTEWNVRDSDATLILVLADADRGTDYTKRQAEAYGRPVRIVELSRASMPEGEPSATNEWLAAENVAVLNVAGPRESNAPGLYTAARTFLTAMLSQRRMSGA